MDLSKDEGYTDLLRKLQGVPKYVAAPVAAQKPILQPQISASASSAQMLSAFEIGGLEEVTLGHRQFAQMTRQIEKAFWVTVKNNGQATGDFSVEISMPNIFIKGFDSDLPENRVEGDRRIFVFSPDRKYFQGQAFKTKEIGLKITSQNINEVINDKIIVTVYSENGTTNREFNFSDIICVSRFGHKKLLSINDFER